MNRQSSRFFARSAYTTLLVLALVFGATGILFAQDVEEVTITHNQGETVVPINPETVITFDLASLSTLNALGIEVAGVPDANYPESLSLYASEDIAKVGSLFEPDYELVNAMEPDLIIVAARSAAVYPQLSEIAPTIDLTADNTDYLNSQLHNAEILGQIFDKEEEVQAVWEDIAASVEAVNEVTAEAGTSLIVMTSGGEVTAYGPDSRFGWLHEELGFVPVIEDIEEATHGEAISFEFILEANPDWLIVIDRDVAIGQESEAAEQILDNELVAQTTAWQNDQVIYLDPTNLYLVMGGLGAIQETIDDIAVDLGIELDSDEEAVEEVTEETAEEAAEETPTEEATEESSE
ncbi:siderophore ABC transporter substrate-binding protein [Phototrophicus methaneseepsis]|uniref:Siderophore ABC transporter substrate-binding protein n=2 Tax=Phototrophicus methaneseepsis TaxID=2710758 RepID=A0A7S8EE56_9CHLR|nr:siderophore ABC transporter substrate-binding protein [Phototrophicus methaneseepsis]